MAARLTGQKRKRALAAFVAPKVTEKRVDKTKLLMLMRRMQKTEERKYLDTRLNNAEPGGTGSVISLDAIAEGTDFNQRVGRKIRGLYLQYRIAVTGVTDAQSFPFRIDFVLDRQPNGTAPTVAQILDVSNITAPYAMKNIQLFEERFKILKTHIGAALGNVEQDAILQGFIDLQKLMGRDDVVHYAGSAAAEPNTNGLYVLIAADTSVAANVNFNGGIRFVYSDM